MRTKRAGHIIAWLLAISLMPGAFLHASPALATPTTPAIQAKQAEAAAAEAKLEEMNADLEERIEEYNAITEELEQTRAEIDCAEADLEVAAADLEAAQTQLGERMASIYRNGGVGVLDVILSADTFEDLIVRVELAIRVNQADAQVVESVKSAKARVEATKSALQQRETEQVALQAEAEARAGEIEAEIAKQEAYVNALDGEVRELIAQEAERQRILAAERARQAAAAAAARASSSGGRAATDPGALGAGHPEVVAIALKYLGVPYRYGGASPSGFDCSGLCMYVYRQIGISLPRTSRSQYGVGQHISPARLDLLKPGDLVFFGRNGDPSRVHHVGMYVGDGNYVHAPQTGDVVKVSSLTARISSRGDYVGASRLP